MVLIPWTSFAVLKCNFVGIYSTGYFSVFWACDVASDIVAEEFSVIITAVSSYPFSRFSLGFSLQIRSIVCGFSQFLSWLLVDCLLPRLQPFFYTFIFSIWEVSIHVLVSPKMFPSSSNQTVDESIKKRKKNPLFVCVCDFYLWCFILKFLLGILICLWCPLVISCSLLYLES